MKKLNKKGFTIVELVIVIAVIAILAAVLIPTFTSVIKKAHISSDKALVKNLNTILASEESLDGGKNTTAHEALSDAFDNGFSIEKISPTTSHYDILWDSTQDRFVLMNEAGEEVYPNDGTTSKTKINLFKIYTEIPEQQTYSIYLRENAKVENATVTVGFDAGNNTGVTSLTYTKAAKAQSVIIRTNGGTLNINADTDTVEHYGTAEVVLVQAVANASYHERGNVGFTQIDKGRYVMESKGKTNALVYNEAETTVVETGSGVSIKYAVTDANQIERIKAGATAFAGGLGTEEDPFIIETAQHLQNIGTKYGSDYYYYQVKDGVSKIDCSAWPRGIGFNGSFDGNGVKIENLSYSLFTYVGYQNTASDVIIKNVDVRINTTAGTAFVRNIFNSGITTFENVHIHGYLEGEYNMGSFYNYGTANYDDVGCDYTVNFIDSTSDATLVVTTGNGVGGFVGHGYEGAGNTLTVNMDETSVYSGTMFTAAGTAGDAIMAMASNGSKYMLNGTMVDGYASEFNYAANKLTAVKPVKESNGYTVAIQPNVAYVKVNVNAQCTVYDAEGNQIQNQSGITWVVSSKTLEDCKETATVFSGSVNSGVIVNDASKETSVSVKNGVLTLNTGSSANYLSGTVTLQVIQYDTNGNIVALGSVVLVTVNK